MRKNRKLAAVTAAVLTAAMAFSAVVALAGSAASAAEEETEEESESYSEEELGTQLDDILKKGVITIGTEGTYPPYSYHDEDDNLTGFEVEVGRAIAEKLGVKAEFVETDWDSLIAGLESERFDIIVNDVTPTEERKKTYDFSIPYTNVRYVIITTKENDSIQSFADLDGKTVSNTIASTHAQIAEQYGAKIDAVDTFEQSVEEVLFGRADATINSELVFNDYMERQPDADLKVAVYSDEGDVTAVPVRKNEKALLMAINDAIEELREEGVLSDLSQEFFGADYTSLSGDGTEEETSEAEIGAADVSEAESAAAK